MLKNKAYSTFPWTTFKDNYPGPWNQSTETIIYSANKEAIAKVKYGNDAELMNAAPELLEALKGLIRLPLDTQAVEAALKIINKVEGNE